ncbi:unnamed protein product [Boreogadus saida]
MHQTSGSLERFSDMTALVLRSPVSLDVLPELVQLHLDTPPALLLLGRLPLQEPTHCEPLGTASAPFVARFGLVLAVHCALVFPLVSPVSQMASKRKIPPLPPNEEEELEVEEEELEEKELEEEELMELVEDVEGVGEEELMEEVELVEEEELLEVVEEEEGVQVEVVEEGVEVEEEVEEE